MSIKLFASRITFNNPYYVMLVSYKEIHSTTGISFLLPKVTDQVGIDITISYHPLNAF